MLINSVEFNGSRASLNQNFNQENLPEIPVCGKSNVGKSSFLNTVLKRKKIAKISSTPGKTQLINYFLVNSNFFIVDLPGYGYAKVSKKLQENWQKLLTAYLEETMVISGLFWLIDIRIGPNKNDMLMFDFLNYLQLPYSIIASKSDKLSKSQKMKQIKAISKKIKIPEENIIPFSSKSKEGLDKVYNIFDIFLNRI